MTTTTTTKATKAAAKAAADATKVAAGLAEAAAEAKRWNDLRNKRVAAALAGGKLTVAEIATAVGLSTVRVRSLRDYA